MIGVISRTQEQNLYTILSIVICDPVLVVGCYYITLQDARIDAEERSS